MVAGIGLSKRLIETSIIPLPVGLKWQCGTITNYVDYHSAISPEMKVIWLFTTQEEREMPSQKHRLIQARLGGLFNLDNCFFNAATELTLEVSQSSKSKLHKNLSSRGGNSKGGRERGESRLTKPGNLCLFQSFALNSWWHKCFALNSWWHKCLFQRFALNSWWHK